MIPRSTPAGLFGILAEFTTPGALVAAVTRTRAAGYRQIDAYAPLPVHGLSEALGLTPSRLPWLVLGAGVLGAAAGIGLQYWTTVIAYPMNVGGRPLASWPSFVPVVFELTILFATAAAVVGMIAKNGLPMPHHPLFGVARFARATSDRFFLCIEAADPKFEPTAVRRFLAELGAEEVIDVAP